MVHSKLLLFILPQNKSLLRSKSVSSDYITAANVNFQNVRRMKNQLANNKLWRRVIERVYLSPLSLVKSSIIALAASTGQILEDNSQRNGQKFRADVIARARRRIPHEMKSSFSHGISTGLRRRFQFPFRSS